MFQDRPPRPPRFTLEQTFSPKIEFYNEPPAQKEKLYFLNPFTEVENSSNNIQRNSTSYQNENGYFTQNHRNIISDCQAQFLEELLTLDNLLKQTDQLPVNANNYHILSETVKNHAKEFYNSIERFVLNNQPIVNPHYLEKEIQQKIQNIENILYKFQANKQKPISYHKILSDKERQTNRDTSTHDNQSNRLSTYSSSSNNLNLQPRTSQTAKIKEQITRRSISYRQTPKNSMKTSEVQLDFDLKPKNINQLSKKDQLIQLNQELKVEISRNNLTYAGSIIEEILSEIIENFNDKNEELVNGLLINLDEGIQQLKKNNGSVIELYKQLSEFKNNMSKEYTPSPLKHSNHIRRSEQIEQKQKVQNQVHKPRYTEQNVRPSQSELIDLKLKFYNISLQRKTKYEQNPNAKSYLLIDLFEEYIQHYNDDKGIDKFLDQKFSL